MPETSGSDPLETKPQLLPSPQEENHLSQDENPAVLRRREEPGGMDEGPQWKAFKKQNSLFLSHVPEEIL